MKLIFDIIKGPVEFPKKSNYHFDKQSGKIGRADGVICQLEDEKSFISSYHASIEYKDGIYFFKDTSTNGTYLKHPFKKLPKDYAIKINSTDVFIIGDYELQARFSDYEYNNHNILSNQDKYVKKVSIIPDDDFLLEDNSIMNNSFIKEEDAVISKSVLNMINEDELESNNDLLSEVNKSETTVIGEDFIYDTVSFETMQEHISLPTYTEIQTDDKKEEENIIEVKEEEKIQKVEKNIEDYDDTYSLGLLEKKLGIELSSLSLEKRERVIHEIADIVLNSLDGLKKSLDLKEKIKKDLSITDDNIKTNINPIKLGQQSLNILDYRNNDMGVKLSDAVSKSFNELDIHNIAIHKSTKNVINISLQKFSPKSLEHHFKTNNEITSLLPQKSQMWSSYIKMFDSLNSSPEKSVGLIINDYAKEYKDILYTLKLTSI